MNVTAPSLPRLYREFAGWWPLLSSPAHYAIEAAWYWRVLAEHCQDPALTLLELGSGGGNNASFIKQWCAVTLVDLSPAMLAVSQELNPECDHFIGDMRTVRLGREFDAVMIHDAIMYMTSEADLLRAISTAYVHCRRGGAALFAPDCTREKFQPSTSHGGDDAGLRGMRYLEWTWDPDPADTWYVTDFAYLLRDSNGAVHCEQDRHLLGLFPRATWLSLLAHAGFEPLMVDWPGEPGAGADVFVGVKR